MRVNAFLIGFVAASAMCVTATAQDDGRDCPGVDLLVSQGWPAMGVSQYYYGGDLWPEMTAAIDAAAATVTVTADLEDLPTMLLYDALWIDQRDNDYGPGPKQLTAAEAANVAAYMATGRRVVIIGENQNWTTWNDQIMGLVGGVFEGEALSWTLYPIAAHALTDGVTSVYVNAGGYCTGGLALFDWNVATEWGGSVITVLDVNVMEAFYWTFNDNSTFATNLAGWIGCTTPVIFSDGFETGDVSRWSATSP
jgi:hypothetical protein